MSQPPRKRSRKSSANADGGFSLLQEKHVDFNLPNFKVIFLTNDENLGLLNRQNSNFVVEGMDGLPKLEWKVSLVVGPMPLQYADELQYYTQANAPPNLEWIISLKYELVKPSVDEIDLKGYYVNMRCDLRRADDMIRNFPDSGLLEISENLPTTWKKKLLPLCSIRGRRGILRVDCNGSLHLSLRFLFFTTKARTPEILSRADDAAMKHFLQRNALKAYRKVVAEKLKTEVTLVANDGKKFKIKKDLLEVRCPAFNQMFPIQDDKPIALEFSPKVVGWIFHFWKTGEVNPFVVKATDDNDDEEHAQTELPELRELIQFADMFDIRDLLEYFDVKLPSLCSTKDDPRLASYLNQLAVEFGLEKSKKNIPLIIAHNSDNSGFFGNMWSLFSIH